MVFKSLYSRLVTILSAVSMLLFILLLLGNAFFLRDAVVDILADIQRPRINRIFAQLDARFDVLTPHETIAAYIDSTFFEYDIYLFSRDDRIIAKHVVFADLEKQSQQPTEETFIDGFSRLFLNPDTTSPFYAIKVILHHPDLPIIKKVFAPILLSIAFLILVSALLGWWLVSYLNRRLEGLKAGVHKLAGGHFDAPLNDSGEDEIAFLAQSFNRMAKQIKQLISSLEESNAARQRMVAHASHEIKSPLTSIKGFIDIIEYMQILPPAQRATLLPAVKKDLQRVIKITNDMLELARLRDPDYRFETRMVRLAELIYEEHSYFEQKVRAQGIQAQLECTLTPSFELECDPDRLSQVLENLWSNALKYGNPAVPVVTTARIVGGHVNIGIRNGLKSPLSVPIERLFEPFYRGASEQSEKVAGSGLGLAIVRELVERLGGRVTAQASEALLEVSIILPTGGRPIPEQGVGPVP